MAHSSNLLLAALAHTDMELLRPHLKSARLKTGDVLMVDGKKVDVVYFPLSAVISLVVTMVTGRTVEGAMVGRDGVLAATPALDSRVSLTRAVVQTSGATLICEVGAFKPAVLSSSTLLSAIMRHEHTLYAQAQQASACIASHDITKRLARYLLRMRDLIGEDTLPLTQEVAAGLLGVRRTSVTEAAGRLQEAGHIAYGRGHIEIASLAGLRGAACECYNVVRSHYSSLHRMKH